MSLHAYRPIARRTLMAAFFGMATVFVVAPTELIAQSPGKKRPLKHSDYEIWNSATGMKLAPDGKSIVYLFSPAAGDGAVVLRNLSANTEVRIPSGGKSEATASTEPQPSEPTTPPGTGSPFAGPSASGAPQFTPDSKRVILSLAPPRSAVDKAKAEKKKPEEMPKTVLAVIEVSSGKIVDRLERVRSFNIVGEGAGYLVYQKEPKPEEAPKVQPKEQPKGAPGSAVETAPQPSTPKQPGGPGTTTPFPSRQPGGPFPGSTGSPMTPPRPSYGTELVIRNLADGTEATFADVAEFSVSRDAKQLVYTVNSKNAEQNGVYVAQVGSTAPGAAVKAGVGRYSRLTWDDAQTKLAFFFVEQTKGTSGSSTTAPNLTGDEEDDQPPGFRPPGTGTPGTVPTTASAPTKVRVYLWDRSAKPQIAQNPMSAAVSTAATSTAPKANPAVEVLSPNPTGLKAGLSIIDRGGLVFSADGLKLSVGVAVVPDKPETTPAAPATPTPPPGTGFTGRFGTPPTVNPDRVDLDLWHWKDEYIQPMQKVRGAGDRNKTYRAVYFLDTKQFRQVETDDDVNISVPGHGDWGVATSDKRYRAQNWLYPTPRDYALVNVRTGEGKPILTFQEGAVARSNKGQHLAVFEGKNWHSISVPDGKKVNLTGKLSVKFFNELDDHPATIPPYAGPMFTHDEKHVLLSDRFDIWKVALDGSSAENITKIGREQKIRFRVLPIRSEESRDESGINLTQTQLLSAENLETHDTGFFRLEPGQKPKLLVMGARRYGSALAAPAKAKNADVFIFTVSTYFDYPDYYVSDRDFREIKRVTDINPRIREFNWGKAELVHYKSADGVPLSGMLVKPEDFDPSKKYPMIVYIYERLSDGLHNFRMPSAGTSINPTFYASNGYLVYMPDIAYSVGTPGQSALKCVLPAIQAVVDRGCVNEAAIGIQGHSWGGYQIAYMVTQTNRFKAAASGAPVSNMVSAYGGIRWGSGMSRQFQYEKTQCRIGKTLWEVPMKYIENSPVFMADRVETPLMILHNDQDDAVPWYQGIEYYMALRRLGKECYLFNYNGEFHGLRKKSTQRDYTLRMQQFFDHHLKGAPAPEWMTKGVAYPDRDKEKDQWKKLFEPERAEKK